MDDIFDLDAQHTLDLDYPAGVGIGGDDDGAHPPPAMVCPTGAPLKSLIESISRMPGVTRWWVVPPRDRPAA